MKKIAFFFLFSIQLVLAQDTINLPDYFYKRLEGKIGDNLNIQMNLIRKDSILEGNYFYENIGEPIYFQYDSYLSNGNKIHIAEEGGYDSNYNLIITGIFDGKFISENEMAGKWKNRDSSKVYNFYLKEDYPEGSAEFEIKHLNRYYGKTDFSPYAVSVELSYPVMVDYPDANVENKVNSYITNVYLYESLEEDNGYPDLENRIDSFIEEYQQEIEADSEIFKDYKPVYENDELTDIAFNSDNILSLEIEEYLFTGGAHGNSSYSLVSFDLQTGKQIKLDDIFNGDYMKKLNEVGEKIFRKNFLADSTQSLYDQGFFGFENGFELNDNFDLYKGGIKFQFNPYEAGAYVLGAPEVFIPYSEIREFIRDDSPLGKIIGKNAQSR